MGKIVVRKMLVQQCLCMLLCVGFAAARDLLVIEFPTPGNTVNASYVLINPWMIRLSKMHYDLMHSAGFRMIQTTHSPQGDRQIFQCLSSQKLDQNLLQTNCTLNPGLQLQ